MLNLLLSLLLLSWAAPCAPDAACRCRPIEVEEAMERADAVFIATVVSVGARPAGSDGRSRGTEVRLRVHAAWKGVETPEAVIISGRTSCDTHFSPGERYLVFGHAYTTGEFLTSYCSGTRRLEPGAENLAALGASARNWPDR